MEKWRARRMRQVHREEQRIELLRQALRQPGRELVLQHLSGRHLFSIVPGNLRVTDAEAAALIRRRYVCVRSAGLFPDQPQSWAAT